MQQKTLQKIATHYLLKPGVYDIYMGKQRILAIPKFKIVNPIKEEKLTIPRIKNIVFNFLRKNGYIKNVQDSKLIVEPILGKTQKTDIKKLEKLKQEQSDVEKKLIETATGKIESVEPVIELDGFRVKNKAYPDWALSFTQ